MKKNQVNWVQRLEQIMSELRSEEGCPWDREQDHKTLKKYLIEEAYELIDAIDNGDDEQIIGEAGDLLLQIIFHCQIAKEKKRFDLQAVAKHCCEKLIRRHPHVFGGKKIDDASQVAQQWVEIKEQEKEHVSRKSILDGIPRHLPALMQAEKIQKRASRVGFDWPKIDGPLEKIEEELREIKEAIQLTQISHKLSQNFDSTVDQSLPSKSQSLISNNGSGICENKSRQTLRQPFVKFYEKSELKNLEHAKEELGDLLFAVVNLARFLECDAEETLRAASDKFTNRFKKLEQKISSLNKEFKDFSLDELENFWTQIKQNI